MTTEIIETKTFIKDYTIITFGLLLFVLGWLLFLIPAEITGGGVSGIAAVVFFATKIPVSVTFLIINAILVIIAIKILGASFWRKNHLQYCRFNSVFRCISKCIGETAC
jgi:uncharacterized membrane-anchored protein YitT (DUF2179 family)